MTKFPEPNNVHEVKHFLELFGYFRRFLWNYSIIARPLTCLIKKNNTFKWGKEERIKEEYELRNGKLYKKLNGKLLWVVPNRVRWQTLKQNHDDLGQPVFNKTVEKLKKRYSFPMLRRYVKGYIGACIECIFNKMPGGKKPWELNCIDKKGIPFHTLHLDHLGPFVKSNNGNSYVLVILDEFTKFTILIAVKNTSSSDTSRCWMNSLTFLVHLSESYPIERQHSQARTLKDCVQRRI